jgi:hypothetical protein
MNPQSAIRNPQSKWPEKFCNGQIDSLCSLASAVGVVAGGVIAGAGVYSFQQHGCSHLQPAEQAGEQHTRFV